MSPREYKSKHTHREHLDWLVHFDNEWNTPDRADHYLMLLITEVRRMFAKNPNSIKLEDAKIEFKSADTKPVLGISDDEKRKQAAAFAKAKWLGMMTAPVVKENE